MIIGAHKGRGGQQNCHFPYAGLCGTTFAAAGTARAVHEDTNPEGSLMHIVMFDIAASRVFAPPC